MFIFMRIAAKQAAAAFCFGRNNMVKINGDELNISGKHLKEFLEEKGYNLKHIAVERNGEIVPKAMYEKTIFQDGDTIEVVSFVGGG